MSSPQTNKGELLSSDESGPEYDVDNMQHAYRAPSMTQELLTLEELIGVNGMTMKRTTSTIEDVVLNGIKWEYGASRVAPLNVSHRKNKIA